MNKQESTTDNRESTDLRDRPATRHGFYSFADQVVVSVASFATTALVGRVGKEDLGIFALGITSVWLLAGISNSLVWTPYTARAAHLSGADRKRFRGDNAGINLAIGVVLALLSLIVAAVSWSVPSVPQWIVSFCIAFAPLLLTLTIREYARRIYIADFEGGKLLLLDIPISVVTVALAFVLKQQDSLDAVSAMLLTSATAIPAVYLTLKHMKEGEVSVVRMLQTLAANWSYGKWLLVVAVAWLASDGILRWMLVGMKGQQAMGTFAGAFLIISLINPILMALTSFARSLASRKLANSSRHALSTGTIHSVRWLSLFALFACGALHFLGDVSMIMILGPNYSNPNLVSVLAIAVCLELIIVPVEAAFVALEFGRLMSMIAVSRLAVSLLLGIILIPIYGPFGVAWAMLGRNLLAAGFYGFSLAVVHRDFSLSPKVYSQLEIDSSDTRASIVESTELNAERSPVST